MKNLDFGDYCLIEQKRYGAKNVTYRYKVISREETNYYKKVPVDANDSGNKIGDVCEVVKAICCGVIESRVETFRLIDVKLSNDGSF